MKLDTEKTKAIMAMPPTADKIGVRRFLGFIQYLSRYLPNFSEVDAPLRGLLKWDIDFQWEHEHERRFRKLKLLCSQPPVLAYYDVSQPI